METRKIGSLTVSLTGLGCNNFGWRIDDKAAAEVVHAALDAGITFFDTADVYGEGRSEEFLGRALGKRRGEAVVATKFGSTLNGKKGAKPEYVREAAEASLRRLGVEVIDLYQIHRPDPDTPIADTLGALDDLVKAGKVREIGCSNFSVEQIREGKRSARPAGARFVSVQNEYSLFKRDAEKDVIPECEREGLAFLPYFPLANGLLTGKYRLGQPPPAGSRAEAKWGPKVFTEANLQIVERLIAFASGKGRTLLDLAFSWLAARPAVASVIAGAVSPKQVRENARAAEWKLGADDLRAVESALATQGAGGAG